MATENRKSLGSLTLEPKSSRCCFSPQINLLFLGSMLNKFVKPFHLMFRVSFSGTKFAWKTAPGSCVFKGLNPPKSQPPNSISKTANIIKSRSWWPPSPDFFGMSLQHMKSDVPSPIGRFGLEKSSGSVFQTATKLKLKMWRTISGGFLKWWYPTTMGFPTKNDHFGVFWGYHHLRKHPSGYAAYKICWWSFRLCRLSFEWRVGCLFVDILDVSCKNISCEKTCHSKKLEQIPIEQNMPTETCFFLWLLDSWHVRILKQHKKWRCSHLTPSCEDLTQRWECIASIDIIWYHDILVGGFNPLEKYWANWIISQVGVKLNTYFETTT